MSKLDFNYLETRRKILDQMPGVRMSMLDSHEPACMDLVFEKDHQEVVRIPYSGFDELLANKRLLRKIRRDLLGIPWWAFWR